MAWVFHTLGLGRVRADNFMGQGAFILRRLAALFIAAIALTACSKAAWRLSERPAGEVRFSIFLAPGDAGAARYWTAILADMSAQTSLRVKPAFARDDEDAVEALKRDQIDLGLFTGQAGLDAVSRAGGEIFARPFDPAGADGYAAVLIVGAKSKLTLSRILRCDRSLRFVGGAARPFSGSLAATAYLFAPRDFDPASCFKKSALAAGDLNLVDAVANRSADVAAVASTALRVSGRAGQVRVIWRSPILPQDNIIWRKDLDPAIKEKVRVFLLTYGQEEGAEGGRRRAELAQIGIGGFRPADDDALLPLREMEAAQIWLLAKRHGDPRAIITARKSLAAITARRVALEARTRAPAGSQ